MSNKQNINYFKMNDLMSYIGIGLMAIGLPIFIFAYGIIWLISCIMLPLGVILFIIGVSIRSGEKDIMSSLKRKTEGVVIPFDSLGINERRINRKLPIEVLEDFEYESGLMYKKGKRGVYKNPPYHSSVTSTTPSDSDFLAFFLLLILSARPLTAWFILSTISGIKSMILSTGELF